MSSNAKQRAQALVETLLWGIGLGIPLCFTGAWMFQRLAFSLTGGWIHHVFVRDVAYQNCHVSPPMQKTYHHRALTHLRHLPGFQSVMFSNAHSTTTCRITTFLKYRFGNLSSSFSQHTLRWQTFVPLIRGHG